MEAPKPEPADRIYDAIHVVGRWAFVASLAGLIGLILYPVFFPVHGGRELAPTTRCLTNLKVLGVSMEIYISDFDDRYPWVNWDKELEPYHKSRDLLTCPLLAREEKQYGYALNREILGKDAATLSHPEKTVVFFESDALAPDVVANTAAIAATRHDGYSNISFADGHAKSVPATKLP